MRARKEGAGLPAKELMLRDRASEGLYNCHLCPRKPEDHKSTRVRHPGRVYVRTNEQRLSTQRPFPSPPLSGRSIVYKRNFYIVGKAKTFY